MKKLVLALTIMSLSQFAFAKGGGNLVFKNSQAGFVSESLEESLEHFVRVNPAMKDMVQNATVVSQTPDDSVVTISMDDGSAITYTCVRFDDWSKGGTVLKKEVVCRAQ